MANFDSDGDTDIWDFNALARNFTPTGYNTALRDNRLVPDPSTASMLRWRSCGWYFGGVTLSNCPRLA